MNVFLLKESFTHLDRQVHSTLTPDPFHHCILQERSPDRLSLSLQAIQPQDPAFTEEFKGMTLRGPHLYLDLIQMMDPWTLQRSLKSKQDAASGHMRSASQPQRHCYDTQYILEQIPSCKSGCSNYFSPTCPSRAFYLPSPWCWAVLINRIWWKCHCETFQFGPI